MVQQYNYRLRIAYDGRDFSGWQIQPTRRTVQGVLQDALAKVVREKAKLDGASRTDAGVHALGQVASFKCALRLEGTALKRRLNHALPPDVVVKSARRVGGTFHARHSARGKLYRYVISCGEPSPLERGCVLGLAARPDVSAMRKALKHLCGRHDFSSFCAAGGGVEDKVRQIRRAYLTTGKGKIRIYFDGNAFLYKMVRNMVGLLLEVGRGRLKAAAVKEILEARHRRAAAATAPPQGLYLVRVYY